MSSITSFFSSFIGTVYADAPEDKPEEATEEAQEEEEEEPEDVSVPSRSVVARPGLSVPVADTNYAYTVYFDISPLCVASSLNP